MSPAPGPQRPTFLAGVDGGGTGTRVRLQDAAGRTLGQGEGGPSGLGQGIEPAWRHVQQALQAAFEAAALPPASPEHIALGLGLAGAGVAAQRAAFLAADPGFALCVLDNDGVTQLLGAHAGGPGLVVAAGTGSVAAARDAAGRVWQCGGWGFPVGDEGSGAWLGLRAMAHAQAVLDGREVPSGLSEAVISAVIAAESTTVSTTVSTTDSAAVAPAAGATADTTAPALLAWCAGATARRYAELAPAVFSAAEAGCAVAQALLQAAADELARLLHALQARAQPSGPHAKAWQVVASGSLGPRLAALWPAELQARLVSPAGDSMDGALHLLRAALAAPALAVGQAAGAR